LKFEIELPVPQDIHAHSMTPHAQAAPKAFGILQ
jgi:hypothetical protein